MPGKFEFEHLLHPTTLDGCIQGTFAPATGSNEGRALTSIASVYISVNVPKGPGSKLVGYAKLNTQGFGNLLGSVVMSDDGWNELKVVIEGLNYKKTSHSIGETTHKKQPWEIKKICSNIVWQADLDHVRQSHVAETFNVQNSKRAAAVHFPHQMISRWLELSGHKRPSQKILEVGCSSGALTVEALHALGGQNGTTPTFGQYVFSDRDSQYFESTRELLKPWEDRLEYKQFDVENNPFEQYFEEESFDVLLAGHVCENLGT